jgi:hypothetical protein
MESFHTPVLFATYIQDFSSIYGLYMHDFSTVYMGYICIDLQQVCCASGEGPQVEGTESFAMEFLDKGTERSEAVQGANRCALAF